MATSPAAANERARFLPKFLLAKAWASRHGPSDRANPEIGRVAASMAFGASIGYLDVLRALNSHPNTQGGMRNCGMPLAVVTLAGTLAFWILSLIVELSSHRFRVQRPRAMAVALIAAAAIVAGGIHPAADRLLMLRVLLSSAAFVIVGLVVYRGLAYLGGMSGLMAATAVGPWVLGTAALVSLCAYHRWIGPREFSALLPLVLAAVAALALRRGTSSWFIAVPWVVALLLPLLDWTPPWPALREWTGSHQWKPSGTPKQDDGRPDVLLVTVDALRADALPIYGGVAAVTPALDRLAAASYVFEQARSTAPWTLPAMASLFTGADVSVHGVSGLLTGIPRGLVTLAEALHSRGYRTAAFGAGNRLLAEDEREFWRGFDTFEFVTTPLPATMWASTLLPRFLPLSYADKLAATDFAPRVASYLAEGQGKAFTWVHFFDPHSPYRSHGSGPHREFGAIEDIQVGLLVPSPGERRDIRALYDGEIAEMDRGLGILLDGLRRANRYDKTLIVVVADHGEEFWDHGSIGHGRSLYRDQIHVPLIVKTPGQSAGVRVRTPVSTANVAATIADVVGLPGSVAGHSLAVVRGSTLPEAAVVSGMASRFDDPRRSVTFDRWVYMRSAVNGREELYDFVADPGEQISRVGSQPLELARGRALLAAADQDAHHARRALGLRVPTTLEVDPILRSMGYIQ